MGKDTYLLFRKVLIAILFSTMVGLLTGVHTSMGLAIMYVLTYWGITFVEYNTGNKV